MVLRVGDGILGIVVVQRLRVDRLTEEMVEPCREYGDTQKLWFKKWGSVLAMLVFKTQSN